MEEKKNTTPSIADNIKTLESCVKKIQKLSVGYEPLSKALKGWGYAIDNSLSLDDPCWDPIKKENSIDYQIAAFKKAVASLVEQKDSLSQVQFYTIQNRTLDMTELAISTHHLADATQFVHLISSGELEGKTSPMKHRTDKVQTLLLDIITLYKKKYDEHSGGMFSRQSTSDANIQYDIKKTVEKLMDEIKSGKFGEELKGEEKGSLYKQIESKFFGWGGRYFIYDHDMF